MKNADKTRSKVFRFIDLEKHPKDDITDRNKEIIQKGSVFEEIRTKFFWDSENTMAMNTGNELAGHMEGTELIVFVSTGREKAAFTAKGNEFQISAVRTSIHGTTVRSVTTGNHLADIFDDSRTRVEFVTDVFIIISKDGL